MKLKNRKALIITGLLSLITFTTSNATAEFKPVGSGEGFLLGIGMAGSESPYLDADDSEMTIFPYIAYQWENAHLGIDGFNYDFYDNGMISLTADLEPRWSFTEADDSPLFNQIERGTAIEAGLSMKFRYGAAYLEASGLHDISGEHDGYQASLELGLSEDFGWAEAGISIGIDYNDEALATHLYGVKADEATNSLAAYEVDADWQPYVQAQIAAPLTDRTIIAGFVQYQELDRSTRRSPLVDSDYMGGVGLVLIRQF